MAPPSLLAEIERIPIFDNHAHAPDVDESPQTAPDVLFPATSFEYPFRLRHDSRELQDAWQALWGYQHGDADPAHLRALVDVKLGERRALGERYPAAILDRLGIETMIVMGDLGRGQAAPRFLAMPGAHPLSFPSFAVDRGIIAALPPTLAAYEREVITRWLTAARAAGAPGVKLATAYQRPLDFAPIDPAVAGALYARVAAGEELPDAEALRLQDHLMFVIARECGRLDLVVNFHTGLGAKPRFHIAGGNPLLLEALVDHPDAQATRFVLVHGGWPFEAAAGAMLFKPNVYADISALVFLQPPGVVAETLYRWLSFAPHKVLFGTDTFPELMFGADVPLADWEEKAWVSIRTGRAVLASALERMIEERLVTRERALELARMVLRDNARRLYRLDGG